MVGIIAASLSFGAPLPWVLLMFLTVIGFSFLIYYPVIKSLKKKRTKTRFELTPDCEIKEVFADLADEVSVLLYVARLCGNLQKKEYAVIASYVLSSTSHPRADMGELISYIEKIPPVTRIHLAKILFSQRLSFLFLSLENFLVH